MYRKSNIIRRKVGLPKKAVHLEQPEELETAIAPQNSFSQEAKAVQQARANPRSLNPAQVVTLQGLVGNRAVMRLLTLNPGVIQRDVDSAAMALFKDGIITVKNSHLKPKFLKEHDITKGDLSKIQEALNELRENAPKPKAKKDRDVSNPDERPTTGGMSEGDGAVIAELNGWIQDTTEWRCDEPSHKPKGKVYTDSSVYYGADNTGHVGWGFKVWTKKKGTMLHYAGNTTWSGTEWVYHDRGT
jgi:hypothetical protein